MAQTTTMTIRLDKKMQEQLAEIAAYEKRSKSFLAAEAVEQYLAIRGEQILGIKKAIAEADRGEVIGHDEVAQWVGSWGTDDELPMPTPQK
jgi:predicted transcriptional regulator